MVVVEILIRTVVEMVKVDVVVAVTELVLAGVVVEIVVVIDVW